MSSVDFDFSPHVITTKILVQVAMVMTQFEFVARNLGFDENHIIRLQEDYGNRDEQCYQMLRKWWESSPKQLPATLEELHEALCFNKQENCLPEVLENSNNYESVEWLSSTTGISEKMLSSNTLQDSDDTAVLCEVATKVTGKWRQVGRLVGLDDTEIDEIHYDYQKVREKAYQMLRKWREKSGSSAVLSHLAIALLIVNQPKAIDFLKR